MKPHESCPATGGFAAVDRCSIFQLRGLIDRFRREMSENRRTVAGVQYQSGPTTAGL